MRNCLQDLVGDPEKNIRCYEGVYQQQSWYPGRENIVLFTDVIRKDNGDRIDHIWVKSRFEFVFGALRGEVFQFEASTYKYSRADGSRDIGLVIRGGIKKVNS